MDEEDMNDRPTSGLPNEVLLNIMKYLGGARSLLCVGGVCRQWRLVSEQNILWKPLCKHMTALTLEGQETCNQPGGYKALYVGWRQKWCSAGETHCEHIQLKYEVSQRAYLRGDTAVFKGQCLAVTDDYILGCSEQNKDKLIVWSSSGIGKELVDPSVPHRPGVFVTHCVVSSDEKCMVLVTYQSHIAQVFDIGSGRKVHELSHPEEINKIWMHKNYLIVNIRKWIYGQYVWDVDTGVQLYQWHGLSSLPDAVVVCDDNLALVCHMQLDSLRRPLNPGSPLVKVYDLTTGDNIVRQYLIPSPASSTIALSGSRSMFACIYEHGSVAVHDLSQDIIKRDIVHNASHICFHGDYLLVAANRQLMVFELSKIPVNPVSPVNLVNPRVPGYAFSTRHFYNFGYGCAGIIEGPSHMRRYQFMYPLWCGLVVTVHGHAVNLWDIVNMRFVKTLVKLNEGQMIERIHISAHKVKCIVSDCSQPNIKCIQLNVGPCVQED